MLKGKKLVSLLLAFMLVISLVPGFGASAAPDDLGRAAVYTAAEGNIARVGTATAQYTNGYQSTNAATRVNNGALASSVHNDSWNTYGYGGTIPYPTVWIEIQWDEVYAIDSTRVMWAAEGTGSNVVLPLSAVVQYWNGTSYVNVENMKNSSGNAVTSVGVAGTRSGTQDSCSTMREWNGVTFDLVTTDRLRLLITQVRTSASASGGTGIGEWEIFGYADPALADLAAIDANFLKDLTENVTLPATGANGSTITWSDSTNAALADNGTVTRPAIGESDATGKITATAVNGTFTATKDFDFSVVALKDALDTVTHDLEAIDLGNLSDVRNSLDLPAVGEWGSTFTWNSGGSAYLWNDGTVLRPPVGQPDATATLTVTATFGGETKTKTFEVTIAKTEGYKQIVSVEDINVSVKQGKVPTLPRSVDVTYADGNTEARRIRWENEVISWEDTVMAYPVGRQYDVKGIVVGDSSNTGSAEFEVVAHVTVVETEYTPDMEPVAEPLPLNKVTLDGDTRLTTNRQLSLNYLMPTSSTATTATNRMLYNFRAAFGENTMGASAPGGWSSYNGKLRGSAEGHFISALAEAYASTGDEAIKAKLDEILAELRRLQKLSGLQEDGTYSEAKDFTNSNCNYTDSPRTDYQRNWSTDVSTFGKGFLSAYSPDQFRLLEQYCPYNWEEDNTGIWAPYYSLQKLLSGFMDAYDYTGSEVALEIADELSSWVYNRLYNCTTESQRTRMWAIYIAGEYGGMNTALVRVYQVTNNPEHLAAAKMFDNTYFFNSLEVNRDDGTSGALRGIRLRHANQHIPQTYGALMEYQATGEDKYYHIANNFWDIVMQRYAHSVGGVGTGESFRTPYDIASTAANNSCECCATYNLLKLTRGLNGYNPDDARYMDYYERALMNQIIGSIDPSSTSHRVNYQYAVRPGSMDYRTDFSCCNGSGMENHVKYQEATYYVTSDKVYVGLYMPTTATWDAKGATLKQDCLFPAETSKITIGASGTGTFDGNFDVMLRVPYWASAGFEVKVNGQTVAKNPELSTYISAGNKWNVGDVIEITMPFEPRLDFAPDKTNSLTAGSVMYGPLVMALSTSTSSWRVLTLDSYLKDESLIKGNGANASNNYTMTVGSYNLVQRTTLTTSNETYWNFNIKTGDGANKSALFETLKRANTFKAENYEEAAYAAFMDVVNTAVSVYQENSSTQDQVDGQVTLLNNAISQLDSGTLMSVSITGETNRIYLGDTAEFTAVPTPSVAGDVTYEWSVSAGDSAIQVTPNAADSSKATVKSLTVGDAKIKVVATQNGFSTEAEYNILSRDPNAPELKDISISGKDKIEIGDRVSISPVIEPTEFIDGSDIKWSVEGDAIEIDAGITQLTITGVKAGKATLKLTVTNDGITLTTSRVITVRDPNYIGNRLLDLIDKCDALNEADFTEASWAALSAAMADAIAVTSNESSTESQINGAYNKLAAAYAGLKSIINPGDVDKTVLAMYIATAEDILSSEAGELRPSSIKALQDALILAKYVNSSNSASQEMVDDMAYDLLWVIVNRKDIVDRSELKELIEIIERLNSSKYKEDGWAVLTEALASAKLVDDESSVAEVTNAYKALQNAFNGLVEIPVTNKSALLSALNNAKAILDDIDSFVPSSVAGLADLYAQAKAVYDSADSTQTQVNSITSQLVVANAKARAKADTTALVKALAQASSLKAANYTSASYAALASEMKAAQAVVGNVEVTQAEVDKKTTALNNAINGLVPVAASVKVSGLSKNMVVGETATATATVTPSNADKTVKWTSSDSKVASINATTGKITAKSAGKATITATVSGKTATYTITVHQYVSMKIGSTKAIQNGNKVTIDNAGTKPFKIGGRTMIPVRFVGEKMGGKVKYVSDSQPITMTYGDITVELKLGSKSMKVIQGGKSKTVTLDVAAQKKNGKTYIPLRAISESLGFAVYYEAGSEYIVVNSPAMSADVRNARLTEAKGYIK